MVFTSGGWSQSQPLHNRASDDKNQSDESDIEQKAKSFGLSTNAVG